MDLFLCLFSHFPFEHTVNVSFDYLSYLHTLTYIAQQAFWLTVILEKVFDAFETQKSRIMQVVSSPTLHVGRTNEESLCRLYHLIRCRQICKHLIVYHFHIDVFCLINRFLIRSQKWQAQKEYFDTKLLFHPPLLLLLIALRNSLT